MQTVSAIIVLYQPKKSHILQLIDELIAQVDNVVIVDNGSNFECEKALRNRIKGSGVYVSLGKNTGIACALNRGISEVKNLQSDYVLLMDQDSLPMPFMVDTLLDAIRKKQLCGIKVAAVGPRYLDTNEKIVTPVYFSGFSLKQIKCDNDEVHEVDHLITSGSLIPMDVFNELGFMEEKLFIDYVDVVWSLHAQSKNYLQYAVCDAFMKHEMGDSHLNKFGFTINVHSPLRNYYMMRNGIWLLNQPWVGFNRKLSEFFKLLKKYIVYSILIGSNRQNIKMMTMGIWHAMTGKMGKYEE